MVQLWPWVPRVNKLRIIYNVYVFINKIKMSVTMIPGTYKLDIGLASDWSVEMRFIKPVGTRAPSPPVMWKVETTLPFDIEYVVVNGGEYYFYDKRKKEMLERFEEDEVKEFFNEKKYLIEYLKTISPVDNWELIG
jgi:hypothetical protein